MDLSTVVNCLIDQWHRLMPEQYPAPSTRQFHIWLDTYPEDIVHEAITAMATRLLRDAPEDWDYPRIVKYLCGILRTMKRQRELDAKPPCTILMTNDQRCGATSGLRVRFTYCGRMQEQDVCRRHMPEVQNWADQSVISDLRYVEVY